MIRRLIRNGRLAEAGLEAYARLTRKLNRSGKCILIACMPKSGSTFLKEALLQATGFTESILTSAHERTEQEMYLPRVADAYRFRTVTQQHVRATAANLQIMNRFRIRPTILTRNIFDVVPSIRDYLLQEGVERFPSLYATGYFAEMDEDAQFSFIITYALPWYFQFYASWSDACAAGKIDALWLTYEELRTDWAKGIARILEYYRIGKPEAGIAAVLEQTLKRDRAKLRINKGISGRGASMLTDKHKSMVIALSEYYPWIDFSPIGIVKKTVPELWSELSGSPFANPPAPPW